MFYQLSAANAATMSLTGFGSCIITQKHYVFAAIQYQPFFGLGANNSQPHYGFGTNQDKPHYGFGFYYLSFWRPLSPIAVN